MQAAKNSLLINSSEDRKEHRIQVIGNHGTLCTIASFSGKYSKVRAERCLKGLNRVLMQAVDRHPRTNLTPGEREMLKRDYKKYRYLPKGTVVKAGDYVQTIPPGGWIHQAHTGITPGQTYEGGQVRRLRRKKKKRKLK